MNLDSSITLEIASPADAVAIASGTKISLRPEQFQLVPAANPKFVNYVKFVLQNPNLEPGRRHYVVKDMGHIVGYIDLRSTAFGTHLNHIWMDSSMRGSGIGSTALRAALCQSDQSGVFDLNVVAGNPAQDWYGSLGMDVKGVDRWFVRSVIEAKPAIPLSAHMIEPSIQKYGIASAFMAETLEKVDFLEPRVLKITVDGDTDVLAETSADRIAAVYPAFDRVAIRVEKGPDAVYDVDHAKLVSLKMAASLPKVIAALSARVK